MDYQYLLYEVKSGVATITLNRPEKLNALLEEMQPELVDALKQAAKDDNVRVLVLTGAGRAFCAGIDVGRLEQQAAGGSIFKLKKVTAPAGYFVLDLVNFPKPTIAAVNGPAVGAGLSLAIACEIRIAAEGARLVPAWVARGIPPDVGTTWLLPRIVGPARAAEIVYTARPIEPKDALAMGLYNRVVPADQLAATVADLAGAIAANPPVAVEFAKRAMQRAAATSLAEAVDYETYIQRVSFDTADYKEAIAAFLQKRPPSFKGL